MKIPVIGIVGLLMLAGLFAQQAASFSVLNGHIFTDEFTGEIMDSFCAENGHHIGVTTTDKNTSKAGCTLTCVKLGGALFVLYDPQTKRTYKLDDQQQPEAFAGRNVIVVGTYDKATKTIRVIEIRSVIETAF